MNKESESFLSESTWVKEIYHIVRCLLQDGRISGNPDNIKIQRYHGEAIRPCGKYPNSSQLNLNQLEWASQKGTFWFEGSIKSLNVILDRGPVKGYLVNELEKSTFTVTLNELNYDSFNSVKKRLAELLTRYGLRVIFEQPNDTHNIRVHISTRIPISEQNVNEFLTRIESVYKTV